MESFKVFCETTEFVQFILNEFDGGAMPVTTDGSKVWSAKKAEILQMWKSLKPDIPIILTPMSEKPEGSDNTSYGEDGIRITGSAHFISAVLGRLKEIIGYENPQTKLRLIFRGVDQNKQSRPDRQSYVFYINLERRSRGKPGRPKKNVLPSFGI
jgi:hypothetical protein